MKCIPFQKKSKYGNYICYHFACWINLHVFVVVCNFFKNLKDLKSFRNTIRESNSLDPYQAPHFVEPDLGQTVC